MILDHGLIANPTTSNTDTIDCDWLKKWQQFSPLNTALVDGDTGSELSYRELYQKSCAGAEALKTQFNLEPGDRVAVLAMNDLSYIVLFFSLQRLGVTLVPVNYRLTTREVSHILTDCDPQLIIIDPEFKELLPITTQTPTLSLVGAEQSFESLCISTHHGFTNFLSQQQSVAMIIYTSGTTGLQRAL